jgi:chromosome segregation ATPase
VISNKKETVEKLRRIQELQGSIDEMKKQLLVANKQMKQIETVISKSRFEVPQGEKIKRRSEENNSNIRKEFNQIKEEINDVSSCF